jgi:adenylate cyclase
MRHLAIGGGALRELNQLRAPMAAVFDYFLKQKEELERYKQKYGELSDAEPSNGATENGVEYDDELEIEEVSEDGSDTEQEK